MAKVKITIEVDTADLEMLVNVHDYITTPSYNIEEYFRHEEFIKQVATAHQKEVAEAAHKEFVRQRLENMREWSEERCLDCNHTAKDHAYGGTGLCCAEGCTHCFKFKCKPKLREAEA
jgi:type I site-specific restriction endonuclease